MSELSPYQQLGVGEDASFEEIQFAKENLKQQYQNDAQVLENIEIAYDAIIMDRLRLRQEGKIKVPEKIRFPEKKVESDKKSTIINDYVSLPKAPNWLQNLINIDQPSVREVTISGLVFLGLITASIFSQSSETLPLLLTIGVGIGFFSLYRKEKLFWRSVGIVFLSFIVAISLGSLLANLIINSGFNLTISTEQFISLFTFCLLWLTSNFLR
jgi:hypothetical protein